MIKCVVCFERERQKNDDLCRWCSISGSCVVNDEVDIVEWAARRARKFERRRATGKR